MKHPLLATQFLCVLVLATLCLSTRGEPKTVTNSRGIEFVYIPAGDFMMGTEAPREGTKHEKPPPHFQTDEYWDLTGFVFRNETPRHRVTISKPFYMGKYEVTQTQWEKVMGNNPAKYKGADLPVERVTWLDVQRFIKKLNDAEGRPLYRLPTEAEWEYCAWAGGNAESPGYRLDEVSWHRFNAGDTTHPIGEKKPNAWGLCDMLGNVWEWCSNWYEKDYYSKSPATDPQGAAEPTAGVRKQRPQKDDLPGVEPPLTGQRTCRGGSFESIDRNRPTDRGRHHADTGGTSLGFRLVRVVD